MLLQASITNLLTASSRLFRCLLDALDAESSQVLTPSLKVGQSLKFSIGYQFYCDFFHWLTFCFYNHVDHEIYQYFCCPRPESDFGLLQQPSGI